MQFNSTTNKDGLIQKCELYTNLGDAGISGDATLLKQFTSLINDAFDTLAPFLYSWNSVLRWDDANSTDQPVATFALSSSQSDYTIAEDDNSLDILNIVAVQVLPSSSATNYVDVEVITLDDPRAVDCLSPASGISGVPTVVLVRGNTLHFNTPPGFSSSTGGKIYFEREASYFASTDTTKEPGIPKPFHSILALQASYDWLLINKPANDMLITRLEAKISQKLKDLRTAIGGRFPARNRITGARVNPL